MLFNSFSYILLLWSAFVLFWALRERRPLRHSMLLIASYWFYAQAGWAFTLLLAGTTLVDWWVALRIEAARGDRRRMKRWLLTSMLSNLGVLGTFKYYDFFAGSVQAMLQRLGIETHPWMLDLALPAGISFYTFQSMSYVIDVWRGSMSATRSLLDFSTFVGFFPQLIAGPIVRAKDFIPQMERPPRFSLAQMNSGLFQILRGMVKKLLMADVLGAQLVDRAFAGAESISELNAPGLILATYAYALQLYGDFAGYSDIAIGSARLMGFELLKNFNAPFKSKSLEEFWSRWHISMSTWFTDYVYVGMGGSRMGLWRACRNVFIAWTLVGLWHGAAWTFVLWGAYHGAWLVILRLLRRLLPGGKLPDHWLLDGLGILLTFHIVAFSMILFRCPDMETFRAALGALGDWSGQAPNLRWQVACVMGLGYLTHFMPDRWQERLEGLWISTPALAQGAALAAAILLFFALRPPGLTPFVYFQF